MASTVYWIGANGNVYLRDGNNVKDAGKLIKDYGTGFDAQFLSSQSRRIADPLPGGRQSTVVQDSPRYSAPAPVYAPKLDIAGLNARARSAAEGAVNPYYTKALNDYLEKAAFQKGVQEQQTKVNVQNLEDQLKDTLETNTITQQRTNEDVTKNLGDIGKTADEFQTDSGEGYDAARIAEAKRASVAGVTGGTAAGQQEALQTKNATAEQRQEDQFKEQREQQELFRSRSFEDITRSNSKATTSKEKGITQANFDLDSFIKNQALEEKGTRNKLEQERLETIANNQKSQATLMFTDWLAGISNPAQYVAALQTYGGLF